MDVLAWLEAVLQTVLSNTKLPVWVVEFIIDMVKRYVTPDVVTAIEKQIVCFICAKAKLLAGPTPDPLTQQGLDALNKLLNCDQCNP